MAQYSEGSVERALELDDAELWTFRTTLVERLAEASLDSVRLAKTVLEFVDEVGKEPSARRARLRLLPPLFIVGEKYPSARRARLRPVVAFATEFYRQLLHAQCEHFQSPDIELQRVVQRAIDAGQTDVDSTAARLDRCLEAAGHIDRNVHTTALLECWLDDLATASTTN